MLGMTGCGSRELRPPDLPTFEPTYWDGIDDGLSLLFTIVAALMSLVGLVSNGKERIDTMFTRSDPHAARC